VLAAFAASVGYVANDSGPAEAKAEAPRFPVVIGSEATRLRAELDAARGELDLANAQLDRWHKIFNFSSKYRVGADLATSIYDISLAEGIEPELGFRLVRVESEFNERATSPVGAVGLTQLMLPTARWFKRDATVSDLRDSETNLEIGFRYLGELIDRYDGDVELALTAYNRGTGTVDRVLERGGNPDNGYAGKVMRGPRRRG
jgi:soluble lytic murein transglycosylase-like protein